MSSREAPAISSSSLPANTDTFVEEDYEDTFETGILDTPGVTAKGADGQRLRTRRNRRVVAAENDDANIGAGHRRRAALSNGGVDEYDSEDEKNSIGTNSRRSASSASSSPRMRDAPSGAYDAFPPNCFTSQPESLFCRTSDFLRMILDACRTSPPPLRQLRRIALFTSLDPDSLCSVRILRDALSQRYGFRIQLHVVSNMLDMQCIFLAELRRMQVAAAAAAASDASSLPLSSEIYQNNPPLWMSFCLIFINLGSRHSLRDVLRLHQIEEACLDWKPSVVIIDSQRPVHQSYLAQFTDSKISFRILVCDEEKDDVLRDAKRHLERLKRDMRKDQRRKLLAARLRRQTERRKRKQEGMNRLRRPGADEGSDSGAEGSSGDDAWSDEEDEDDVAVDGGPEEDGEYFGAPTAIVIFEALQRQAIESASALFLCAVSAGYHLLVGNISKPIYDSHIHWLQDEARHLAAVRSWRQGNRLHSEIRVEANEPLVPLLRFTTLADAVTQSTPFIHIQARNLLRGGYVGGGAPTAAVAQGFLSKLRVSLQLKRKIWAEQFRLLPRSTQKSLLRDKLTAALSEASNTREEDLILPAFSRTLHQAGFPDRMTSIDAAYLLLVVTIRGLAGRVALAAIPSGPAEAYVDFAKRSARLSTTFVAGLKTLEWLTCPESFSSSADVSAGLDGTKVANSACTDLIEGSGGGFMASSGSQSVLLALFCELYVLAGGARQSKCGGMHEQLADFVTWGLCCRRETSETVLRLLAKRRLPFNKMSHLPKHFLQQIDKTYRRSQNREAFIDDRQRPDLMHHMFSRQVAAIISDCIARGRTTERPQILLLSSAVGLPGAFYNKSANAASAGQATAAEGLRPERSRAVIVGYKPFPDAHVPNAWGSILSRHLSLVAAKLQQSRGEQVPEDEELLYRQKFFANAVAEEAAEALPILLNGMFLPSKNLVELAQREKRLARTLEKKKKQDAGTAANRSDLEEVPAEGDTDESGKSDSGGSDRGGAEESSSELTARKIRQNGETEGSTTRQDEGEFFLYGGDGDDDEDDGDNEREESGDGGEGFGDEDDDDDGGEHQEMEGRPAASSGTPQGLAAPFEERLEANAASSSSGGMQEGGNSSHRGKRKRESSDTESRIGGAVGLAEVGHSSMMPGDVSFHERQRVGEVVLGEETSGVLGNGARHSLEASSESSLAARSASLRRAISQSGTSSSSRPAKRRAVDARAVSPADLASLGRELVEVREPSADTNSKSKDGGRQGVTFDPSSSFKARKSDGGKKANRATPAKTRTKLVPAARKDESEPELSDCDPGGDAEFSD